MDKTVSFDMRIPLGHFSIKLASRLFIVDIWPSISPAFSDTVILKSKRKTYELSELSELPHFQVDLQNNNGGIDRSYFFTKSQLVKFVKRFK